MPIRPEPHKYVCTKCAFSKIVAPRTDFLAPWEYFKQCPKCGAEVDRKELSVTEKILVNLFKFKH